MAQPLLLINEESTEVRLAEPQLGIVGGFVQKMRDRPGLNQDSCAVLPTVSGLVLAVADGVGGGPEGGLASRIAIQELHTRLENPESEVRGAILDAFEAANQELVDRGTGACTTLSVVELEVKQDAVVYRPYHAGDSSIVVCGGRGRIKLSTVNHSPVGYAVEAGLLPPDEALHHTDLNLVSNLVGMKGMRIDMGMQRQLSARDTVVVGSDGLFDNVHLEEIVALIRKGPIERATDELAQLADQRMQTQDGQAPSKPDDLAFLIYRPPRRASPG